MQTKRLPGFRNEYPLDEVDWLTSATAHATSWFHADTEGFMTIVDCLAGIKIWYIAQPPEDIQSVHAFF